MRFSPRYIVLFIWCCIAALAGLCIVFPADGVQIGDLSLRWTTLARVLDLEKEVDEVEESTISALAETGSPSVKKQVTSSPIDSVILPPVVVPSDRPLQPFFEALRKTSSHSVRVVHYGDSQIEEDRISMVLRYHLQALYGGGGVGLVPLHQTIPTLTLHQSLSIKGKIQTVQQGPKRNLVYGPKSFRLPSGDLYGAMGQVATMNDSLVRGSEDITLSFTRKDEGYTQNAFSQVRLWADSSIALFMVDDSLPHRKLRFKDTTSCSIMLRGKGHVYGLSLETPTGVIVDNIPMRGCLGTVFTNINHQQLYSYFRDTHTALIIMQFGGNAIPFTTKESSIRATVSQLRKQVQYMRSCAPETSILFIGPSDMLTNDNGELHTHPLVPFMDRLLQKMAAEEGIAYWSLYDAMGGYGSMLRWQQMGLAGKDGVHFTRRGAEKAGDLLWKWIVAEQERYQSPAQEPTTTDSIQ